jgi:phosphonate degradation associated HDIG domain protein
MSVVDEIVALFGEGGSGAYFGERVTQLQHALQSAHCAVQAHADDELVVAALLHDVGHLLGGNLHAEIGVIDHDSSCVEWLRARGFSERLIALVSGHVAAKRYLVATRPEYRERLSEASTKTLALQGGAMSDEEARAFAASPYFRDLLRLRSWDEAAKDPEAVVPGLDTYRDRIEAAL